MKNIGTTDIRHKILAFQKLTREVRHASKVQPSAWFSLGGIKNAASELGLRYGWSCLDMAEGSKMGWTG